MKAFITGSNAYGKPTAESDLDLVVLMTEHVRDKLLQYSDFPTSPDKILRFGKLNIVGVTSELEAAVWLVATKELETVKQSGPTSTKKKAAALIDDLLASVGLDVRPQSG